MPRPTSPIVIDPVALRILREKDGHTKTTLARAVGLSPQYLNDLETGHRRGNARVIGAIAEALNIPRSLLEQRREEAA